MKNELYFESVAELGNLYLEYIFLEFEREPILFTCVDNRKQLWLCICSEIRGGQRWVISKCNIETLQLLIEKKLDLLSAFYMSKQMFLVVRNLDGEEKSCVLNAKEVEPLDLPQEGTLLKCDAAAATKYLMSKKIQKSSLEFEINIDEIVIHIENTYNTSSCYLEKSFEGLEAFERRMAMYYADFLCEKPEPEEKKCVQEKENDTGEKKYYVLNCGETISDIEEYLQAA